MFQSGERRRRAVQVELESVRDGKQTRDKQINTQTNNKHWRVASTGDLVLVYKVGGIVVRFFWVSIARL